MTRRQKKKKSRGAHKPSLISAVPFVYIGVRAYEGYKSAGATGAMNYTIASLTGYDLFSKKFDAAEAGKSIAVIGGTYVAKRLVAMSRVNSGMRGLPFRL
jgi:hypothetical protein